MRSAVARASRSGRGLKHQFEIWEAREEAVARPAWSLFAKQASLDFPMVRHRVQELAVQVQAKAQEAQAAIENPGLDSEAFERFSDLVRDRAHLALQLIQKK